MIVGHSFWDIGKNRLLFWCESTDLFFSSRGKNRSDTHPFSLKRGELRSAALAFSKSSIAYRREDETLTLLIPSLNGLPLPSDGVRSALAGGSNGVRLSAWRIPCLSMSPYQALAFLTSLEDDAGPPFAMSSSTGYWRSATRFMLELVARGCFRPFISLPGRGKNRLRGGWEAYCDENDGKRLGELAEYMPPECVASPALAAASRRSVLKSFVNCLLDAFVRESVGNADFTKGSDEPSLPELYMNTLGAGADTIETAGREVHKFHAAMSGWLGGLDAGTGSTGLRTCFRIEEPPPVGGAEDEGARNRNDTESRDIRWALILQMQSREDPSLIIPARKIWDSDTETVNYLGGRFGNLQETFLEDLGRAAKLSPEIERILESPEPTSAVMTTEEAYTFLKERAPLLEQSGFGIMAPPWWRKPSILGIRLKVRPADRPEGASTGLFGIESLAEFDWSVALGEQTLSSEELERLIELKIPLVNIRGMWVEVRREDMQKALLFFSKLHANRRMTVGEAFSVGLGGGEEMTGLRVLSFEADGWIKEALDSMRGGEKVLSIAEPVGFKGKLRPYQSRGVSWMTFMNRFGFGVCLADDMGLGKTVEMIASFLHGAVERAGKENSPSLLICPMSIIGNWDVEISRFAPSLRVMIHHGAGRLSGKAFTKEAGRSDIVITTYALAMREQETLSKMKWNYLILDEAQNVKNPSAKQRRSIATFTAAKKVALTGTPIENRLSELWSIMDILNPGYLGNMNLFDKRYVTPVEKLKQSSEGERLRRIISPFVLRRLKTDKKIIRDLPEKMEMKVHCSLTEEQTTLYESIVRDMLMRIESADGMERRGLVLSTLTKLKQVCNHPALFLHDRSKLEGRSGKVARLVEMLEEAISEGDRSLIFTQYAEMGTMLQSFLRERLGCEILYLHGGTPKAQRDVMVRMFQESQYAPHVFILSLKAGGLGLNLTAANRVFHFDRWWNPAVENQATDRAHRIGQKKNVLVHKFVSRGTLEEKIDTLIETKKELLENVVGSGEGWLTELSTDQLKDLFVLNVKGGG